MSVRRADKDVFEGHGVEGSEEVEGEVIQWIGAVTVTAFERFVFLNVIDCDGDVGEHS